jgi:hypothetical protein
VIGVGGDLEEAWRSDLDGLVGPIVGAYIAWPPVSFAARMEPMAGEPWRVGGLARDG